MMQIFCNKEDWKEIKEHAKKNGILFRAVQRKMVFEYAQKIREEKNDKKSK